MCASPPPETLRREMRSTRDCHGTQTHKEQMPTDDPVVTEWSAVSVRERCRLADCGNCDPDNVAAILQSFFDFTIVIAKVPFDFAQTLLCCVSMHYFCCCWTVPKMRVKHMVHLFWNGQLHVRTVPDKQNRLTQENGHVKNRNKPTTFRMVVLNGH